MAQFGFLFETTGFEQTEIGRVTTGSTGFGRPEALELPADAEFPGASVAPLSLSVEVVEVVEPGTVVEVESPPCGSSLSDSASTPCAPVVPCIP
ncbi:MAG: hypothetical protein ACO3VI_11090 [Ilumatobacteraceae bacterium]